MCAAGVTGCTPVDNGNQRQTVKRRFLNRYNLQAGWTFVSDGYAESVAMQSEDYMYFGYWLQSPEDSHYNETPIYHVLCSSSTVVVLPTYLPMSSMCRAFLLTTTEALSATYRGGAAGMYVTRKLSFAGRKSWMDNQKSRLPWSFHPRMQS